MSDAGHFFSYWKEEEELAEDAILLLNLQRKRQESWNENRICVFQQLYELDPKRKKDRIRGCTWKGESESLEWLSLIVPVIETPLEVIAQHFGTAVVSPQEPMRLDVLQIPKPWGYEGWYTGVEKRGVALTHDRFGRTELPYALGLFPEQLLNGAEEQLILLTYSFSHLTTLDTSIMRQFLQILPSELHLLQYPLKQKLSLQKFLLTILPIHQLMKYLQS